MEKGPIESQECAGIWYERKKDVDFYEGKELVERMLDALDIEVTWVKPEKDIPVWYDLHQSADLWHENRIVGRAGKASKKFLAQVAEGDAFIFEIDANFLMHLVPLKTRFVPLAKYPSTEQDLSILVPLSLTVAGLGLAIRASDSRITEVVLIDSFEKPEWPGKKSLSFRITAASQEGTLTKEEITSIFDHVHKVVVELGAEIR